MLQDVSRQELPSPPGHSKYQVPSTNAELQRAIFVHCEAPEEWKYKNPQIHMS